MDQWTKTSGASNDPEAVGSNLGGLSTSLHVSYYVTNVTTYCGDRVL